MEAKRRSNPALHLREGAVGTATPTAPSFAGRIDSMATPEEMMAFRIATGITEEELSSPELDVLLDNNDGDIRATAANHYDREAQKFAKMVNVSESGSSRSLGDLYRNAIAMGNHYRGLSDRDDSQTNRHARTRLIKRS